MSRFTDEIAENYDSLFTGDVNIYSFLQYIDPLNSDSVLSEPLQKLEAIITSEQFQRLRISGKHKSETDKILKKYWSLLLPEGGTTGSQSGLEKELELQGIHLSDLSKLRTELMDTYVDDEGRRGYTLRPGVTAVLDQSDGLTKWTSVSDQEVVSELATGAITPFRIYNDLGLPEDVYIRGYLSASDSSDEFRRYNYYLPNGEVAVIDKTNVAEGMGPPQLQWDTGGMAFSENGSIEVTVNPEQRTSVDKRIVELQNEVRSITGGAQPGRDTLINEMKTGKTFEDIADEALTQAQEMVLDTEKAKNILHGTIKERFAPFGIGGQQPPEGQEQMTGPRATGIRGPGNVPPSSLERPGEGTERSGGIQGIEDVRRAFRNFG